MQKSNSVPVTVVIPTYKRPDKLEQALQSVKEQTVQPYEIIVVNDDPESNLYDICSDYDGVRLIDHRSNKGAPTARNTGIKASDTKYIALLDDDDEWKSEKLEKQVSLMESLPEQYGLVYTGSERQFPNNRITHKLPTYSGDVFYLLLRRTFIPSETPLIRRKCFGEVGYFDTSFESSQDTDMWLRIARRYKFAVVPEILAKGKKEHNRRIGEDICRKYKGHKRLIEKYRNDFAHSSKAAGIRYNNLGYFSLKLGKKHEARAYYIEAFRQYSKLSFFIYYILSYFPVFTINGILKLKEYILEYNYDSIV